LAIHNGKLASVSSTSRRTKPSKPSGCRSRVDGLDEEEAKKILFVCLTAYAEDGRRMDWLVKNWQVAPFQ
jgi:hypothetical protein